jgi:SAM-dependent methyltransferase
MTAENFLKGILPVPLRRWLRVMQIRAGRLVRRLRSRADVGSLRRTMPVDAEWGWGRGQVIDRYYIESFLTEHAEDVRGHVLDFADDSYARKFGGAKATKIDVLHLTEGNPRASLVADLARAEQIASQTFDCIICTQVLLYVFEVQAAIRTLHRILKPGGILLVTVPGIQKIDRGSIETGGDYWRFTTFSLRRLFEGVFAQDHVDVKGYGNVLVATAFLYGFAVEDLRRADLEYHDPEYEVTIALRAVKPQAGLAP